jgi:hypothetical protein
VKATGRLDRLESEIAKGEELVVIHGGTNEELDEKERELMAKGRRPKTLIRICAPGLKTV